MNRSLVFATLLTISLQLVVASILHIERENDLEWSNFDFDRVFEPVNCTAGKQRVCRTCNDYAFCINGNPVSETKCETSKPYCRSTETSTYCDVTPGDDCQGSGSSNTIECQETGYFPDPIKCTHYHYCKAKNIQSFEVACRSNFVFNETNSQHYCRRQAGPTDCNKIQCPITSNFVPYGTTLNRFYAFCQVITEPKPMTNIFMFACEEGMIFDRQKLECIVNCKAAGQRKIHSRNPKQYYECYRKVDNGSLEYDLNTCPGETVFNPESNNCAPGIVIKSEMKMEWILQDELRGDID